MKDEEMAEEYARKTLSKDCCDLKLVAYKRTINSFLAGLKAGRPQWHDLEKDPNDLPKTDKDVIVYRKDSGSDFDYYRGGAWFGNANGYESEQPIAWCEIPTFEKE